MRRTFVVKHMLLLSESNVRQCLSLKECLDVNRVALTAVAQGTANVPTRIGLPYHNNNNNPSNTNNEAASDWTLFKPASYVSDKEVLMGMKLVSIRAQNPAKGLPTVPASVLALDAETGVVKAMVAATYLTAARTAAGSAISTALVRPDLQHLVVFGAGLQAQLHIQLIATAIQRPIPKTTIINRTVARAEQLQDQISKEFAQHIHVVALEDRLNVADALSTADVCVTATNAVTPLFDGSLLPSGCHICSVGSYTPQMREIPARTVDRCKVIMDTPEARLVGDLDNLSTQHPVRLLGEVLYQDEWLRQESVLDMTFYKSVGTAIQDVLTANAVVERALQEGIGAQIDMN